MIFKTEDFALNNLNCLICKKKKQFNQTKPNINPK